MGKKKMEKRGKIKRGEKEKKGGKEGEKVGKTWKNSTRERNNDKKNEFELGTRRETGISTLEFPAGKGEARKHRNKKTQKQTKQKNPKKTRGIVSDSLFGNVHQSSPAVLMTWKSVTL